MLKHKKVSVKKICPGCGLQFPVAVKTCTKCKHSFYLSKKDITPKISPNVATATTVSPVVEGKDVMIVGPTRSDGRRRTERVRREKPNYYDASAFIRKTRKRTEKPNPKQNDNFQGRRGVQITQPKKGVTPQKQNYKTKVMQDPEDKIYHTIMKNEKAKVCAIILTELNDKLMLTSWRP
ncbi:Hypothetical protein CINCED_3A011060 [Cinara cedri]|uniref:Uncharacterized protein n=1 Tax=Cinara cedri TaxID=506608 RepID=A0A5E4MHP8_9HEMI|nr:Hypothetical protein CINCED_3A011060 [Cinara cedri]